MYKEYIILVSPCQQSRTRPLITRALRQALRRWWNSLVHLTLLNFFWLACQLLIVTGPPATAVVYLLADRLAQDELITPRDVSAALRAVFVPAWRWGLCNLVVIGVLAGWWWWAGLQTGVLAAAVTCLVLLLLAYWLTLNAYYWPLWLAQSDASLRNTLRNAFVLTLTHPGASAALLLISLALTVLSALTILPLIHALMVWLALFGLKVTAALVEQTPTRPAAPNS